MERVTFGIGIERKADGSLLDVDSIDALRNEALEAICSEYGGYSARNVDGGWFSPELQKVISERSLLVETFTDKGIESHRRVAGRIKAILSQESIMVAVQQVSSLEFV